ncbi:50S ribosomal protein L2 [Wolbachia endosymbiont of Cruorifilaria tuberocauda]|uniref:50S ribosomal protein L2 n=1 Tax=Wolbachia endosymbiont of Cruorifilaria tuberocauda TaxID=1812111 RepID=UPI00158A7B53|nr:50S ribosomal protein L2 [Wolbachia endosymbiont of Cruorifilaria tuberocauda]QKX01589.1 50S ribosomal protein L2 [Wolbachia endosymbiont of Cruorifilaria tuberocauda]
MRMKFLNPVTPSSRGTVLVSKVGLSKDKPEKSLTFGKKSSGGRNNYGRITVRHKGGGHKRKYRVVDFKRNRADQGIVEKIEYDPNRSGFLALILYKSDNTRSYILAPQNVKPGDLVISGDTADILAGNCLPLKYIPVGSFVHGVELKPGGGAIIARAAGCYAQIIGHDNNYVLLRLRSGQVRLILSSCRATIGVVSNLDRKNRKLGKAGRNRWLGVRPTVRGVAMNPVDHPHGGGEGKTSGGRHPVTPWGIATKGKKTRKKGKLSDRYIEHLRG